MCLSSEACGVHARKWNSWTTVLSSTAAAPLTFPPVVHRVSSSYSYQHLLFENILSRWNCANAGNRTHFISSSWWEGNCWVNETLKAEALAWNSSFMLFGTHFSANPSTKQHWQTGLWISVRASPLLHPLATPFLGGGSELDIWLVENQLPHALIMPSHFGFCNENEAGLLYRVQ
jgi:hypothetical protein